MRFHYEPSGRRACLFVTLLAVTALTGCKPTLTGLDVTSGPEHTVVMATGTNLLFTNVIWDAGLASERTIPGGFLGGYMFSVPPGASLGNHPVAVANSDGRSASINFNVTAPQPFPAPRIDAVTMMTTSFDGAGHIKGYLYVQGANLDVGSVVRIGGMDIATTSHKALRNDLYGIAPAALAYPIYHFVSNLGVMEDKPVGSTIQVTVRNLDGQVSDPFPYTLAASAATLDSDGDGLLDTWEDSGYDANGDGVVDINLQALGANKYHRDVFLEVDVMNGLAHPPIATVGPTPGTFDTAKAVFAAAPILNPTTASGINLVIDSSGTVPHWQTVGFTAADSVPLSTANYSTLKAANFNNGIRDNVYHYAIWADMQPGGYSGISDVNFGAGTGGDDFIVSFDDFPASYQSLRSQVETLVHEFGHNLGQRHGGDNHSTYKPNYWSVMSYSWQLRTGQTDAWRRGHPTCGPFYYQAAGATEPGGALPGAITGRTDYSDGSGRQLVENTNSINEPAGVCGIPIDWNNDGHATDLGLNRDVDQNGSSVDTVRDYGNWRALVFRGPATDGTVIP